MTFIRTHGMKNTKIYGVWCTMKSRCYTPSQYAYKYYGGRGIAVCDRWRYSFESFLEDMGMPPSPRHWIDRIDNDGDYSPSNCKWSTISEQQKNRRSFQRCIRTIRQACFSGAYTDWAAVLKISPEAVRMRVKRYGSVLGSAA